MTALASKAETTRQHILDSGRALVLNKGFVGVGLQEILTTSGVPKGSFYYYFPSKEAFGCALLQQYVDDYRRRLDALWGRPDEPAVQRLMRYWSAWIDDPAGGSWAEQCLVVKLAAEIADLSEDMRLILSDGVTRLQKRIAAVITEGHTDGSISGSAAPDALAQVLYQMWLGAALLAKLTQDKTPLHRALDATHTLLDCHPVRTKTKTRKAA